MGIDASIPLGVRPPQFEDPTNILAKSLAIQKLQQDYQTSQQSLADTNKLNELYRVAMGSDGTIDRNKLYQGAASQGLGSHIPKLQKEFLGADEAKGKVDKQNVELLDLKLKQSRQYLDGVTTPEQFLAWHEANHRDPIIGAALAARGITAEQSREKIIQAMQSPDAFQQLLNQSKLGTEKFMEMNKPTIHTQNLGGTSQISSIPGLGGAPTVLSNTPITQSEDSKAREAVQVRGQNMADARSKEANNLTREANQNVYDPERGMLVNKATGLARPAATLDGNPVAPKDKQLPEAAQKQVVGARNLQDAIDKYKVELKGFGKLGTLSPDARAKMGNAYNNMMLQAKEAYNLGVLNGPDYDILQSVVKDPTKFTSLATSNAAMAEQADSLKGIAANIERTTLEAHGKKYAPRVNPVNATGGFKYLGVVQ